MGVVLRKVSCPSGKHDDRTPSCAVYEDNSMYCFSCNYYAKGDSKAIIAEPIKEKEDLNERFKYINSLENITHRGLSFRHDNKGYYITWPGETYYKLRSWAVRPGESKYIGARGHKKPWFGASTHPNSRKLLIIEGEINAISVKEAAETKEIDVISPGGASNFFDREMKSKVEYFRKYATIGVLVDNDEAGAEAAIKFHKLVKPYCSDIRIKLMEKDANTILIDDGKEKLKEFIMGVFG